MTYLDEARKALETDNHLELVGAEAEEAIRIVEPFIRADEQSKLLSDEAVRAGADAEYDWINPHMRGRGSEERETSVEPFKAGLEAALASHPTPDGAASPVPAYDPALECCCGHTAYWHGQEGGAPEGSGECEFTGQCGCKRFLLRRPLDGSKAASPVLPDDEHPILLALREALGDELEQSEDWRNDEGEEFIPNDPAVEALGVSVGEKLKPLLGASPVLGDEERERLLRIAADELDELAGHHGFQARIDATHSLAAFLRKLASQEGGRN